MLLQTPLDFLSYNFLGTTCGMLAIFTFYFLNMKRKKQLRGNLFIRLQNLSLRLGSRIYLPRFITEGTLLLIVESAILAAVQMLPAGIINGPFGDLVGTGLNYFGLLYFAPIIYVIVYLLLGENIVKQFDFMTPAFPLILTFAKLGCFSGGCCRGMEWEHGLYNYASELYEFPSQLLEAFIAIALFIFFMYYRNKAKPGTMFPLYLTLYSSIRFFTEFTRCEENVLGILKTYHILCLIGTALGIIYLFIAIKFGVRISEWFDRRKVTINEEMYLLTKNLQDEKHEKWNKAMAKSKKRREVRKRKGRIKF